MSSLQNPEAFEQSSHDAPASQQTSSVNVSASLAKFWDTVRSSAELIVTLRQEVVQLRAQNASLEASVQALSAVQEDVVSRQANEELEQQAVSLQGGLEARNQHLAERDQEQASMAAGLAEAEKLHAELSQARIELCEYELQVSAREAELHKAQEELQSLRNQYDDLVEYQKNSTLNELQELNEVHEQRLSEAQLEAAELRQTMERMKTEKTQLNDDYLMLAEKYQAIEVQVAELQTGLYAAQEALQQAHLDVSTTDTRSELTSHEVDALRVRLSELEAMTVKAADAEERMLSLQDEIDSLQEQLEKALGIVEVYRAAGLRHVEDPDRRNQMSLFSASGGTDESRQLIDEQAAGKGLSPEEMEALAERLDNLATRVAQLLGIS
ncbi:MAG: hypothetical protein FJ211_03540 [Ignavibacteria bacterium]|nr:hypothetical protein [Ignavibacteria bacterium]